MSQITVSHVLSSPVASVWAKLADFGGVHELEKVMVRAYSAVRDVVNQKSVDLRTAAFVLGVQRVGRAALARQATRETINFD